MILTSGDLQVDTSLLRNKLPEIYNNSRDKLQKMIFILGKCKHDLPPPTIGISFLNPYKHPNAVQWKYTGAGYHSSHAKRRNLFLQTNPFQLARRSGRSKAAVGRSHPNLVLMEDVPIASWRDSKHQPDSTKMAPGPSDNTPCH